LAEERTQRRLAAILAADVVGYSRLMEADEAATFERLRAHRKELFEPEIARHHGRIFKLMGDGLLAEFGSVVDAVECAVLLQRAMAERNNGLAADHRIDVRIGVHVGDVIVEAEDRHGDAVIIASRLQQLAERGGICVSGAVADHVRRKVALRFESRGEERLKNIADPIAVYRVGLGQASAAKPQPRPSLKKWSVAAALALLLVAGAVAAWLLREPAGPIRQTAAVPAPAAVPAVPAISENSKQAPPASPPETTAMATPAEPGTIGVQSVPPSDQGIPVIIVLPLQDLTGKQAYRDWGKGIAEAFITDLSTFADLEVVSSTSSFAYADRPIPEIVKSTGAIFVVEGSIRLTGDKAMITVQLIRGSTDRHLKVIQIEESVSDPVAFQTAVADKIRDELGGVTGILRHEYEKIAGAKVDASLTEYDYHVRGGIYAVREEYSRAIEQDKKGLERFPDSVLLRCKLAMHSNFTEAARMMEEVRVLQKRTRLEEWVCHWASALVYANRGDRNRAIPEAKAVIAMAPYDTVSHAALSKVLQVSGLHDEAIEWAQYAVAHDPNPQKWYFNNLLEAYRAAGKIREAIELGEAEIRRNPSTSKLWHEYLGKAYAAAGQMEKAKEAYRTFYSLPDPSEP